RREAARKPFSSRRISKASYIFFCPANGRYYWHRVSRSDNGSTTENQSLAYVGVAPQALSFEVQIGPMSESRSRSVRGAGAWMSASGGACLLARFQIERVFLDVLDDFLIHHLSLEALERAL